MGNSLKNRDRVIKEGHKIDLRDIHILVQINVALSVMLDFRQGKFWSEILIIL